MQLELIRDKETADDSQSLTVFIPERDFVRSVRSDQPHFKLIKRLAYEYDTIQEGDPEQDGRALTDDENQDLIDLFEVQEAVNRQFHRLSERYTMKHGILYKDGDAIHESNPWAQQVLAFVQQGVNDYEPLIKFQEKLDANPNPHSREQFFKFLSQYPITITDEGDVVLYKGVRDRQFDERHDSVDAERYPFESCSSGPNTIVDDVQQPDGRIKQGPGSVVEHPRSLVHFNPDRACSNGLHCGTYEYAKRFGSVTLRVLVNPRDVVNVPNNDHKVRVCRYSVLDVAAQSYEAEALLVVSGRLSDDGAVTNPDVDPSEPPYVPSEATYDGEEGDCPQEPSTEPTEAQSASDDLTVINDDTVSDYYCFGCLEEHEGDCDDPQPVLPPEPEEDAPEAPTPPRKRYPSPGKWQAIQAERKIRKKGIRTLAAREGWVLDNEDEPNERKSWVIPPKS